MKKLILSILLLFVYQVNAQYAQSYYDDINLNTNGTELKNQLSNLIKNTHSYNFNYWQLYSLLKQTDLNPENPNNVLLLYGYDDTNAEDDDDLNRDKNATCGGGNPCTDVTWNREHVFPKSLSPIHGNVGPNSDPHMLRATDVELNALRGNKKFIDATGVASKVVSGSFYPGEHWKGDVARIIMYMYLRYGNGWAPNKVGVGGHKYNSEIPDVFLKWNAEDPVSQYEVQRNEIIEPRQGNRNPFIDNPYLATLIWGGPKAENKWYATLSVPELEIQNIEIYPNPSIHYFEIKGISHIESVEIYNELGQQVPFSISKSKIGLNQSGLYYIIIHANGNIFKEKIIIK